MASRKIIKLVVDISRAAVRDSSGNLLDENWLWLYRADAILLRFHFQYTEDDGQTYLDFPIPPAATLKFMVKDPDAITGAAALATSDHDQWNVAGDWADTNIVTGKCCCRVSTNTDAMTTYLATTGTTQKVGIAEVEMQEPGADPVTLVQFRVGLRNDVIRGTEGTPIAAGLALATVPYVDYQIAQVRQPDGAHYRFGARYIELWDPTLNAWLPYGSDNGQLVRVIE